MYHIIRDLKTTKRGPNTRNLFERGYSLETAARRKKMKGDGPIESIDVDLFELNQERHGITTSRHHQNSRAFSAGDLSIVLAKFDRPDTGIVQHRELSLRPCRTLIHV